MRSRVFAWGSQGAFYRMDGYTIRLWGSIPESFEVELDDLAESMLRLQADPTRGGPALGVPEWDARLWRMGRESEAREMAAQPGADPRFDAEGLLCWRDWDDLESILGDLKKPGELDSRAAVSRDLFERLHHPDVFAGRLRGILEGSIGPDAVSAKDLSRALARPVRPTLLSRRVADS